MYSYQDGCYIQQLLVTAGLSSAHWKPGRGLRSPSPWPEEVGAVVPAVAEGTAEAEGLRNFLEIIAAGKG